MNRIEITILKAQLAMKVYRFRDLQDKYDCGLDLFLYLCPEAHELAEQADAILDELAKIDPAAPRGRFLR